MVIDQFSDSLGVLKLKEPLSKHTTWKIGGEADLFIIPNGKKELRAIIHILNEAHCPWMVLGKGSNSLFHDNGFRGAIIDLGKAFQTLTFEHTTVQVGGAHPYVKLCVLAAKQGLTGLEFAGGVPGTVGGAIYMNAGAHGSDTATVLRKAEILWEDGTQEWIEAKDLKFSYRHSLLQERKGIVLEAIFELAVGERLKISKDMAQLKERRLSTQPIQLPCAGSVFRNPPNHHAAKLIQELGLKGFRIGGAEVSNLHANFIINTGNATAEDVKQLIAHVRQKVRENYSIELHTEILMFGS